MAPDAFPAAARGGSKAAPQSATCRPAYGASRTPSGFVPITLRLSEIDGRGLVTEWRADYEA